MAETLPFNLRATKLGIVSGLAFGRDQGGLLINSRHVEPYWSGELTSPPLTRAERIEALAFLDDCVDRNLRLDVVHPSYRYPIGYTSADWPMGGADAELSSVTSLRTIVVSAMNVGIVLTKGSRLCLIQGDTICYRKVVTTVTVSSAIAQSINIGPRLPPGVFVAGATVRFANPFVRTMVVPESWDPDESIDDENLRVEVMETLR